MQGQQTIRSVRGAVDTCELPQLFATPMHALERIRLIRSAHEQGEHSPRMLSKQRRITQAPSLALACCCAWVMAFLRMQQKRGAASP